MKLIELTKVCNKCEKRKSWKEFRKKEHGRHGIATKCIICARKNARDWQKRHPKERLEAERKYHAKNPEKIQEKNRRWQKANPEKQAENHRQWRQANPEKKAEGARKWRKANPEKTQKSSRNWRQKNPEKANAIGYAWRANNLERARKNDSEWVKKKYKTNSKFKLKCRMSRAIARTLKNGKDDKSWLNLVPYTLDDLIKRLKKTLPEGYTWNDYLKKNVLHLDHVIPISVHNFESYENIDFKRCWALKNLQLLPAKENLIKGTKLTKHFQPSLLLELKEG